MKAWPYEKTLRTSLSLCYYFDQSCQDQKIRKEMHLKPETEITAFQPEPDKFCQTRPEPDGVRDPNAHT